MAKAWEEVEFEEVSARLTSNSRDSRNIAKAVITFIRNKSEEKPVIQTKGGNIHVKTYSTSLLIVRPESGDLVTLIIAKANKPLGEVHNVIPSSLSLKVSEILKQWV